MIPILLLILWYYGVAYTILCLPSSLSDCIIAVILSKLVLHATQSLLPDVYIYVSSPLSLPIYEAGLDI